MIAHTMIRSLAPIAMLLLAVACNPARLMEKGQYDDAIELSARKLTGKKNKKTKYVKALEESFSRATQRDMRKAKALEEEGLAGNWIEINRIYRRIARRQELIEPLLPLVDADGYKAEFKFVRVEGLISKSKEKAAEYYYDEGMKWLEQAEQGDKQAAREAYHMFDQIEDYYTSYREKNDLMKKAQELGTVYVLFSIENRSNAILPRGFEKELKRMDFTELQSQWKEIHTQRKSRTNYDMTVVLNIREINVSPDLIKEREYVDDKVIEDGWEYVLDDRGNVVKDTAGNDVKVPRKVFIKATVFETYQSKSALVAADLDYFDERTRERIFTDPISAEAIFENYAATFKGDKRALSNESKNKIGNSPVPFPASESLILEAVDHLKPLITRKIADNKTLF